MATIAHRGIIRDNPGLAAAVGTVIGYVLVIGTFLDLLPIYPSITLETSTMLSHTIAIVNTITVVCLLLGWYWIRREEVNKHRIAMVLAFVLILLFLVLYLLRIGGGETKVFAGPDIVRGPYIVMLAVHIILSILAVPLVLYALILGMTRTIPEIRQTNHSRIGRIAAAVWIVSLVLGLVTYLMLEHLFRWEPAMVLPI